MKYRFNSLKKKKQDWKSYVICTSQIRINFVIQQFLRIFNICISKQKYQIFTFCSVVKEEERSLDNWFLIWISSQRWLLNFIPSWHKQRLKIYLCHIESCDKAISNENLIKLNSQQYERWAEEGWREKRTGKEKWRWDGEEEVRMESSLERVLQSDTIMWDYLQETWLFINDSETGESRA